MKGNLRYVDADMHVMKPPDLFERCEAHARHLSLTTREYFHRNCWAAVEGSEPGRRRQSQ